MEQLGQPSLPCFSALAFDFMGNGVAVRGLTMSLYRGLGRCHATSQSVRYGRGWWHAGSPGNWGANQQGGSALGFGRPVNEGNRIGAFSVNANCQIPLIQWTDRFGPTRQAQ